VFAAPWIGVVCVWPVAPLWTMRYRRAVEKIRILAEACEDLSKRFLVRNPC
jgi:hypothetical protein